MKQKSLWSCFREAINSIEDGQLISRKQLLVKVGNIYPDKLSGGSFDIYRQTLTNIKVLEWIDTGQYKKLQNFPESLTTSKAHKLENQMRWYPSWKDWFAENLEARIKML